MAGDRVVILEVRMLEKFVLVSTDKNPGAALLGTDFMTIMIVHVWFPTTFAVFSGVDGPWPLMWRAQRKWWWTACEKFNR